jgi:hypothetical protein
MIIFFLALKLLSPCLFPTVPRLVDFGVLYVRRNDEEVGAGVIEQQ